MKDADAPAAGLPSRQAQLLSLVAEGRAWLELHGAPLEPVGRWCRKIELALLDLDNPMVQSCLEEFINRRDDILNRSPVNMAAVLILVEHNINLLELAVQIVEQQEHMQSLSRLDRQLRGLSKKMFILLGLTLVLLAGLLTWWMS